MQNSFRAVKVAPDIFALIGVVTTETAVLPLNIKFIEAERRELVVGRIARLLAGGEDRGARDGPATRGKYTLRILFAGDPEDFFIRSRPARETRVLAASGRRSRRRGNDVESSCGSVADRSLPRDIVTSESREASDESLGARVQSKFAIL